MSSWSLDRGYDTGLPEAVAAPVGSSAAQLQATLDGEDGQTAAQRYSPWAPRSTADIARPGQSAVMAWGVGEQQQAFRGRVRRTDAHAASGSAQVTALDGAELMRGAATVPPCVSHVTNGIKTAWLVDHALRMCGIYTSPPPRQDALYQVFFASMYGSLEANMGMRTGSSGLPEWRPERSPWTAGPFRDQPSGWSVTWAPQRRVLSQVTTLMVEWWVYRRDTDDTDRSTVTLRFGVGEETLDEIELEYNPGSGVLRGQVGDSTIGWGLPGSANQAGRYKVAFEVTLPAVGNDVELRGWLYQPDGTLYSTTTFTAEPISFSYLYEVAASSRSPMECIGVSRVSGTVPIVGEWRRGAVIDLLENGSTGSSSYYALDALPDAGGSWWDLIKAIAADTLSYVDFDSDGVLHFRRYEYVRPEGEHTPALTITSRRDIAEASVGEEIDAIANRVAVGVTRFDRSQSYTQQQADPSVRSIPPGGTTVVEPDLEGRAWFVRCPMMYAITQPLNANAIKCIVATGAIAPVEVELTHSGGQPILTLHNRGSGTAYTATGTSLDQGSLRWAYADVTSDTPRPLVRTQQASIDRYGVQSLDIGASPWRQNVFFADQIALQLLEWTTWPVPLIGQIDILPDPRIELGDIVRLVEPTGARVDGLFRVMAYQVTGEGPHVAMRVSVQPLYRPDLPADVGLSVEPVLDPAAAPELPG